MCSIYTSLYSHMCVEKFKTCQGKTSAACARSMLQIEKKKWINITDKYTCILKATLYYHIE